MLNNYLFIFDNFTWSDAIDVGLIAFVFYVIYIRLAKTRILPILQAFMVIMFLTFLSRALDLNTIHYILQSVVSLMFVAAIILFPAELKRGLNRIGDTFFNHYMFARFDDEVIGRVLDAVKVLGRNKIGALIAFEGNDTLTEVVDSGVVLNAQVERKLILSIFEKTSPLHDGAMVIANNRIKAASCFVPQLSTKIDKQKNYGSRHLAGLGLSEETDAFVIIVSEETGKISVAKDSSLINPVSLIRLNKLLEEYFNSEPIAAKKQQHILPPLFKPLNEWIKKRIPENSIKLITKPTMMTGDTGSTISNGGSIKKVSHRGIKKTANPKAIVKTTVATKGKDKGKGKR